MRDQTFIAETLRLACQGVRAGHGGPFGALVVMDGVVVGHGENRVTSLNDPTAHAEVMAIRAACAAIGGFELPRAVLYASCEPCPMCLGAAYWARVEKIVFAATRDAAALAGFDDAFIYDELCSAPEERRIPAVQFKSDAASFDIAEPFRLWQAKENKVRY